MSVLETFHLIHLGGSHTTEGTSLGHTGYVGVTKGGPKGAQEPA